MKKLLSLTNEEILDAYQNNKLIRNKLKLHYIEASKKYIDTLMYPYEVTIANEEFQLAGDEFEYAVLMNKYTILIKLFNVSRIQLNNYIEVKDECNRLISTNFAITEDKLLSFYKELYLKEVTED